MIPARVGFGSESMEGVLNPQVNKIDPIMTQTFYVDDGQTEVAWIMQDCYNWSVEATTFLREVISRRSKIPEEHIVIQSSENHANHGLSSTISRAQAEFYGAPMAASVNQAKENAKPACMAAVIADVGSRFSIRRRKYINEDLGTLSFWYDYNLADGKADATDLVKGVVACLCSENPSIPNTKVEKLPKTIREYDAPELREKIYYEDPVDNLVHFMVFRATSGETLGSMIRFSAHVTFSELLARTAGYPGFARKLLEKELGGTAGFLLGPQGDLIPRLETFGTEQTRQIGEGIARAALDAFEEQAPEFRPVEKVAFARSLASVPLRKGVPLSPEEAEVKVVAAREELAQAVHDRAPIGEIKKLLEQATWLSWVPRFFYSRAGLTTAMAAERHWPLFVHALAINEVVLAGLVAETGYLTTKALREEFGDWVLPLSEVNGCINYIAADGDQQNGGYEATLSIVGPLAEGVLRSSLGQAVREVQRG